MIASRRAGTPLVYRIVREIRMRGRLKAWLQDRRWRKRHAADIRAFLQIAAERAARRIDRLAA